MGLLDRLPGEGRRGVVVAVATGVVALLVSGLLAWHTWGGDDTPAPTAGETRSSVVPIVSRRGGFVLAVPASMKAEQVGKRAVRVRPRNDALIVTVGPGPEGGLKAAHRSAVDALSEVYAQTAEERQVETTMGGGRALRSVGSVRHASGKQLIFSVTTTARGQRTWSAVMFAKRDVRPGQLKRWYQPVLDGFRPLG